MEDIFNGCNEDIGFNSGNCRKDNYCSYCEGRFQGRLDVLEEWEEWIDDDFVESGELKYIKQEIAKIKEVLHE